MSNNIDLNLYYKEELNLPNCIGLEQIKFFKKTKDISEQLKCTICNKLPFEPFNCKGCKKIYGKRCMNGMNNKCPTCKVDFQPEENTTAKGILQNFDLYCPNKESECSKTIKLDNYYNITIT